MIQKEAVSLQAKMDELRFEDFRITDYPVAFFCGNNDYVVSGNGKEYEIVEMMKGHTFSDADFKEEVIVKQVDANEQVVSLYKQELKLLKKAAFAENIDDIKALIIKYKELEEERYMEAFESYEKGSGKYGISIFLKRRKR